LIAYRGFLDNLSVTVSFFVLFLSTFLIVVIPIVVARYGKRIYGFFKFWLISFWLT
jgi:hypothetical protein